MKTRLFYLLSFFVLVVLLGGCQTIDIRGQYVDEDSLAKLETKSLTQAEIIELIGTPTVVPDYSKDTWYYIQRSIARRAWASPKVIEQRIVKIIFNKDDSVREVIVLNDSHISEIETISEYTKTYGTEKNGLQKFIGNIGRYNKLTDGKKRKSK